MNKININLILIILFYTFNTRIFFFTKIKITVYIFINQHFYLIITSSYQGCLNVLIFEKNNNWRVIWMCVTLNLSSFILDVMAYSKQH